MITDSGDVVQAGFIQYEPQVLDDGTVKGCGNGGPCQPHHACVNGRCHGV